MTSADDTARLAPERRIALAYSPELAREALGALLILDARLGEIVARSTEPVLAQMRLAWWRESLAGRQAADPLAKAISAVWQDCAPKLAALVDGWEELLGAEPLGDDAIGRFAAGRGASFAAFADLVDAGDSREQARRAGLRWGLADFAFRTSHLDERKSALTMAQAIAPARKLPRALRGLQVLDALAKHAVSRGEPFMHGRGAPLVAMRVGLFGR